MKTWQEAFPPPFKIEGEVNGSRLFYSHRITASNHKFAIQCFLDNESKIDLVDKINGLHCGIKLKTVYDPKTQNILDIEKGDVLFTIRGWGYLTGTGGLNLPHKEAMNIQDSLGNYISEQLNKFEK